MLLKKVLNETVFEHSNETKMHLKANMDYLINTTPKIECFFEKYICQADDCDDK